MPPVSREYPSLRQSRKAGYYKIRMIKIHILS